MAKNNLKATIFLPVYNGENDHLEETLKAVFNQKADFDWELFIIDSGSRDNSVKIVNKFKKRHKNLRFEQIGNGEFSHGKTRQYAAEASKSEFMVYLTQDATPANENWLSEMIKPFGISDKIVAVLGRQVPRYDCFPAMKYDIEGVFGEQGVNDAITLWTGENKKKGEYGKETFYSDVCSAAPRKFLTDVIKYRAVDYSEDYEYGRDIIEAGYIKAYNASAVVTHSNQILLSEYKKRIFDESFNVRKNSGVKVDISWPKVIYYTILGSLRDSRKIIHDRAMSRKRKIYWLAVNPLFYLEKWRGVRLANKVEIDGDNSKYSLEKTRNERN